MILWANLVLGLCVLFSVIGLSVIVAEKVRPLFHQVAIDIIEIARRIDQADIDQQRARLELDFDAAVLEYRQRVLEQRERMLLPKGEQK